MSLRVHRLQVHYGKMLAVSAVSLEVAPGQIVALVGANGAGKSTTLRAISGLVSPSGGSIALEGEAIGGRAPHRIARRGVAHVPEGRGLLPGLTVADNIRLGLYARSGPFDQRVETERAFELFPTLRSKLKTPAGVLSGGEQQMLSLARAVVQAPRYLMIDEMSLGLAPRIVDMLMRVIVDLAKAGVGVLCVEQNTRMILKHADRAYVLETGKVVLEGKGTELLHNKAVVESYLGREGAGQ